MIAVEPTHNPLALMGLALTVAGAVGGIIWAVVGFVDRKVEPLVTATTELTAALRELKVALFGVDGSNGMRSEVRRNHSDIEHLSLVVDRQGEQIRDNRHDIRNVRTALHLQQDDHS